MMSVSNKVALVTGAAQGLGKAFAVQLLKNGGKVGITDVNETEGHSTEAELAGKYGEDKVIFVKCDITKKAEMKDTFNAVKERLGGLDIVINNAGIGREMEGWELTVDINVKGTIYGTMLAMEHMRTDKGGNGGVIINVASMAGINPNPCGPVYSATKGAILMYSLSWARNPQLAANKVRMNVLCPAFADTAMFQALEDETNIHVPQIAKMIKSKVGLMTTEYVAQNLMELILDETKNGAIMTLSETGGKNYHKL